ncbi:MAG: DEAD/DEAH box helicase family protein [Kofleriaceae bacterium]
MSAPSRGEELRRAIATEEATLARLERACAETRTRLATARAELESATPRTATPVPRTNDDKVALFRQLFLGREDVFPTRFESKQGKAGYSPACDHKFAPGLCDLPRVKCGDCKHQAFTPVSDDAILDHLRGQHVMGVYPLLADETCWFLAVDFDKSQWMDDVRAFVETCRQIELPAVVERSRSGNGAHVWLFFSAPVPASTARKLGCHLLTETMSRRRDLGMDSYDRLFPSQDLMPRGGFGNLIALPLQRKARDAGNSIFLDDQLVPYPDDEQWACLASARRIEPDRVKQIVAEATRRDAVIGVRPADDEGQAGTPWLRLPSGRPPSVRIDGPLPKQVHAVLAQRLFVTKAGLPSPLVNQIKRLAAFRNPEFHKKQSLRLSTNGTPSVIACAEELADHIALPRGCTTAVEDLLRAHEVGLVIDDQRCSGAPVARRFLGTLTPIQEQAARALQAHDLGVLVAPPGIGKTVVGIHAIAQRACSTLVLVHRQPLLDQWRTQLAVFLEIDAKQIGQIGGGKRTPNGQLDLAMIQSLGHDGKVADLVASYGMVVVDECHHLPARSFERVMAEVKARYVIGLTATPKRRDGHHPITEMQLGPVRFAVSEKSQAARHPFSHHVVVRDTAFLTPRSEAAPKIQELYAALAADEGRNSLILDDVIAALEQGRSPILLTERKDHLDYFAAHLEKLTRHLVVLHGGMGVKQRRAIVERLAAIPADEERLVVAIGRFIGEGFDDARLDTLFLALPLSWKGTLVQYAGRLHRLHPGKTDVRIYDYVDRNVPMLDRMFAKRLRGYRAIGYTQTDEPAPARQAELEVTTVEYDPDESGG